MEEIDIDVDIHETVNALRQASETPAKQRATNLSPTVDRICDYAFRQGLSNELLLSIVEILANKNNLDQTSITNIAKNLYPNEKVSTRVVTKIVSGLGQGKSKPSNATQALFVKWLALVQGVLDQPNTLSRLYSVFFNLLDMISLRAPLCHLLALITRRRHVRPFRIQYLLELSRVVGAEPALLGLLRVYKDYYPDIILGKAAPGRGSIPPQPDEEWSRRLQAVHERANRDGVVQGTHNGFRVNRQQTQSRAGAVIPEVHTSLASESSITLEEIESAHDFVEKLESIELPNQLISSLHDPLLQKFLQLNPSQVASARLHSWLTACLEDELELRRAGVVPSPQFSDTLDGILHFTRSNKSLLPIADSFLRQYLPLWDGTSHVEAICHLLPYIPRQAFQDVYESYLTHVEKALLEESNDSKTQLLGLYGNLARSWIVSSTEEHGGNLDTSTKDLLQHVSILLTSIMSTHPLSGALHSGILSMYEIILSPGSHGHDSSNAPMPIVFPSDHIVYHLLFGSSLSDISRLCGVLATCKHRFEALKSNISRQYPAAYTDKFNGHLMDICNLLWRSRAFNSADANATGCLCPAATRDGLREYLPDMKVGYELAGSFGLSHNYLISAFALAVFRKMEEAAERSGRELSLSHLGPVTNRNLPAAEYKQYRVKVLTELEVNGLGGIKELMFSTMTNLKDAAK